MNSVDYSFLFNTEFVLRIQAEGTIFQSTKLIFGIPLGFFKIGTPSLSGTNKYLCSWSFPEISLRFYTYENMGRYISEYVFSRATSRKPKDRK